MIERKPIEVLSLFSGIGAFEKGLQRGGIPYHLIAYCEIDPYASKSYSAIHGVPQEMNLGDITKVDADSLPKDYDLLTYGFPCTDISTAGQMAGFFNDDGSLTRSGLFFEALRIIETTQPKVAIAENVKNLVGKKFRTEFATVINSLKRAGYNSYYRVLNATDYGTPQNRERIFIVSIRKDVDTMAFKFPKKIPLTTCMRDFLEDEVDESFYLSERMIKYIDNKKLKEHNFRVEINNPQGILKNPLRAQGDIAVISVVGETVSGGQKSRILDPDGVAAALTATDYKQPQQIALTEKRVKQIGNAVEQANRDNPQRGRIYDPSGVAPTLTTVCGGGQQPCVPVKSKKHKSLDESIDSIIEKYGYLPEMFNPYNETEVTDISPTITASCGKQGSSAEILKVEKKPAKAKNGCIVSNKGQELVKETDIAATLMARDWRGLPNTPATAAIETDEDGETRIRRLTPREYFRLQAFGDDDYDKAAAVCSKTRLYMQAGNSICVNVAEHLLRAVDKAMQAKAQDFAEEDSGQLTISLDN